MRHHTYQDILHQHRPNFHRYYLAMINYDILQRLYERPPDLRLALSCYQLHLLKQVLPDEIDVDLLGLLRLGLLEQLGLRCFPGEFGGKVGHVHEHTDCNQVLVDVLVFLLGEYLNAVENGDEVLLAQELDVVVDYQFQALEALLYDLLLELVCLETVVHGGAVLPCA